MEERPPDDFTLRWNGVGDGVDYLVALRRLNSVTYDSLLNAGASLELDLTNIDSPTLVSVAARSSDQNESLFSQEILIGK